MRARRLPEEAQGEAFRAVVARLAREFASEPKPLAVRVTHRDLLALRRDGAFPSGPTIGAKLTVRREEADALIALHQAALREAGASLFLCDRYLMGEDGLDLDHGCVAVVPTDDPYAAIAAICSAGTDWGWVSPGFYVRDLRAIEAEHPFRLIVCEPRSIELEFAAPIGDADDLARRLGQIRTHLGGPGLPEYPADADVAEALRRHRRIHFHWE